MPGLPGIGGATPGAPECRDAGVHPAPGVPPLPRPPGALRATAIVTAVCSALFALITWQVTTRGPLRALDEHLGRTVVGGGPPHLTEFLADLGSPGVALPVLAAAAVLALHRRHWVPAAAVVTAMALVPALVAPLKVLTDRAGPLTLETGYFPSGHAATAMVAYTGAALLAGRRLVPVAVLLTVGTGIGLVLRGYHWPLDVLASWSLAGMLLAGAVLAGSRAGADVPPRPRAAGPVAARRLVRVLRTAPARPCSGPTRLVRGGRRRVMRRR